MLQRGLVPPKVLVDGVILVGWDQLAELVEERKVLFGVLGKGGEGKGGGGGVVEGG